MWTFRRSRGVRDETPRSIPAPAPNGPFPYDFGRYRLVRYLGGGGMGAVYLADDLKLEIKVALKVPHPNLLEKPKLLERFYREASAAARLDHPGLCWVLDVGEIGGTPYFVMRYIAGKPLSSCPPPAPRAAAMLVRSVALAMATAHRLGVIHRDLKPANIVVTPGGDPVVADFGIALVLDPEAQRMTDAGAMMGTLPYTSPEQLRGDPKAIGPASDVYSLGVVLYELLSGKLPYKNPIVDVLLEPSRHPAAAPPPDQKPNGDPALDAICLKALARDIKERYSGMDEFAAALAAYLGLGPAAPAATVEFGAVRDEGAGASRVLLDRAAIRFAFVGHGEHVLAGGPPPGRLYLDVGNDRRVGVIDHHQVESAYDGSTARLVLAHPELIDGAAAHQRDPASPFTIVLHNTTAPS